MKKNSHTHKWIAAFFLALFSLHIVPLEWWHHHDEHQEIHHADINSDHSDQTLVSENHQCPVCDFQFTSFFKVQSQNGFHSVPFHGTPSFIALQAPLKSNVQLGFSLRGPPLS